MPKIVYNSCYGGFSLSRAAILRGREITGDPMWGGPCIKGDVMKAGGKDSVIDFDYGCTDYVNLPRHDKVLVQVVEELGDKANGDCAKLKLRDCDYGAVYQIESFDGRESVEILDGYRVVLKSE